MAAGVGMGIASYDDPVRSHQCCRSGQLCDCLMTEMSAVVPNCPTYGACLVKLK